MSGGMAKSINTIEGSYEIRTEACLDLPTGMSQSKGSSSRNQPGVAKERKIKCQEFI